MNAWKEKIIKHLFQQEAAALDGQFTAYRQQYPYDVDIDLLEGYWQLANHHLPEAKELLLRSKKYNPYDVDTCFLLGEWHSVAQDYYTALECFFYVDILSTLYMQRSPDSRDCCLFYSKDINDKRIQETNLLLEQSVDMDDPESACAHLDKINKLEKRLKNSFDLYSSIVQDCSKSQIGKTAFIVAEGDRFCAYGNPLDYEVYESFQTKSILNIKGELLKILHEGNSLSLDRDQQETVLLPIASKEPENRITICPGDGSSLTTLQQGQNHFNYYRIKGSSRIFSEHPMVIGEPIRLGHDPSHKKLVISFFVDGLSWKLLQEEGLEKLMPNTYRFFSQGLICENFFTTSDWTYPSLASFVSGAGLPNHMMIHPAINRPLPADQDILFEYLKEAGYYTGMINGDWRSSATYGYTRGIDRYLVKNSWYLREGYVISDAIEHIDAFRETDQYLWLTYPDLHDIADGFDLSVSIQTQTDYTLRKEEERSATSVKQSYSPQKRSAYLQALRTADIRFQPLYHYLEQNYTDDEFVITLFGDHGQTYLIPPEEHHLARYHSNVAFMVRGGGYSGISREYISAVDYPHILCKLASVPKTPETLEGQLPEIFGGESERRFTITETLHPNDPYEAAVHARKHTFYLTTHNKVTDYGRLDPGEFETRLVDEKGNILDDPKLVTYYVDLIRHRLRYILTY